jgi:hypothetical protein
VFLSGIGDALENGAGEGNAALQLDDVQLFHSFHDRALNEDGQAVPLKRRVISAP